VIETGHTELSKEPRSIRMVHDADGNGNQYVVGTRGVTKILAYDEHGDLDFVPWIAVFTGEGKIWVRFPAKNIAVYYQ